MASLYEIMRKMINKLVIPAILIPVLIFNLIDRRLIIVSALGIFKW